MCDVSPPLGPVLSYSSGLISRFPLFPRRRHRVFHLSPMTDPLANAILPRSNDWSEDEREQHHSVEIQSSTYITGHLKIHSILMMISCL